MNENDVRRIANEVYQQNQTSGQFSPVKIPLHVHNGIDNKKIPIQNIGSVNILPVVSSPSTTTLMSFQLIPPNNGQNGGVFSIPTPVIENATGDPFVLGDAPDGTIMLGANLTTLPISGFLFARIESAWYYVALTLL